MTTARPWSVAGDCVQIIVRLTPRGGRDAIEGIETLADGRSILKVRVRAAPTEGEANAALAALIARHLRLPASLVAIAQGATARVKTLRITAPFDEILARLEAGTP